MDPEFKETNFIIISKSQSPSLMHLIIIEIKKRIITLIFKYICRDSEALEVVKDQKESPDLRYAIDIDLYKSKLRLYNMYITVIF